MCVSLFFFFNIKANTTCRPSSGTSNLRYNLPRLSGRASPRSISISFLIHPLHLKRWHRLCPSESFRLFYKTFSSSPLLFSSSAFMYSAGQHMHYDMSQYYPHAYAHFAPSPYPERTSKQDRRRPKYTRSKTGCLTCRKKKVKVRD